MSVSSLQINLPSQWFPGTVVFKIFKKQFDYAPARIWQCHVACDMRSDEQIRTSPKWVVIGKRLLFENIQSGQKTPATQFTFQCLLVDHRSTSDINDQRVVWKHSQAACIQHMQSFGCAWERNDKDICFRKNTIEKFLGFHMIE